ncbi:MAG: glycosyltransferase family 2 protein [Betaproteobacteria bacterium]|nr:MAG: glycosyltransferase family 2 protein [Betaproteobacteria bacterium]
MSTPGIQYSIVVPIYGDGDLAHALCAEIHRVMSGYVGAAPLREQLELIFVNDGSRDASLEALLKARQRFDFVRVIDLSRNFGQHSAIACGMRDARGGIVLRMNVDMQDPPSAIPTLVQALKEGAYDLVVGQYSLRKSPLMNRLSAYLYYVLFRLLTGFDTPQNTSPLRAMSRRFVDAYNALTEKSRFPQGLDQWLGFRHQYVEIEHHSRADGRSAYGFWSRLRLGINGILYFSDRPLQLVAVAGFFVASLGLLLAAYIVAERLLGADYLPGFASLASIALIAFGIQLGCTGLVGLYVAKIFREVQNRPLYLVREKFDQPATPAQ